MQGIQTTLSIGSVIHNRYRIKKLLGKGGFGAVYLVQDQRVRGNLFALKEVIDPDEGARERFAFEGGVLKRLDHPALLRVYREFEDVQSRRLYMLMDFVDGTNLEKVRLQQPEKCFPLADVLQLMAPIFAAVAYLHRQQPPILHRDIKPANIMVPKNSQETVLVDLDIAREYDQDEAASTLYRCTPGYAAPEQYAHGTNPRTDLYGLAATLYVLLTGVVPKDALSRILQWNQQHHDPLEPLHTLAPAVPTQVADAVMRSLSIESSERFHTTDEFWQAIQDALPADLASPPSSVPQPAQEPQFLAAETDQEEVRAADVPSPDQKEEETRVAGTPVDDQEEAHVAEEAVEDQEEEAEDAAQAVAAQAPRQGAEAGVITHVYPAHAFHDRMAAARSSRKRRPAGRSLALIILVLFVLAGGAAFSTSFFAHTQSSGSVALNTPTHQPQPTFTPAATPTSMPTAAPPPSYPQLQLQYQGQISDQFTIPPTNSTMGLSHVQQEVNDAQISGSFTVGAGLIGSGDFTGSVTQDGKVQFLVKSGNGLLPLLFTGTIQSDGSIRGTYCSARQAAGSYQCDQRAGGYGTWLVSRNAR